MTGYYFLISLIPHSGRGNGGGGGSGGITTSYIYWRSAVGCFPDLFTLLIDTLTSLKINIDFLHSRNRLHKIILGGLSVVKQLHTNQCLISLSLFLSLSVSLSVYLALSQVWMLLSDLTVLLILMARGRCWASCEQ